VIPKTFDPAVITIRLPGPPLDLDLSNDGSRMAVTVYQSSSVYVYDTATGDQLACVGGALAQGRGVVFGPGERYVYGLAEDPPFKVELWRYALDGGAGELVTELSHNDGCYALIRNQAADIVAVLGRDARVLDGRTGDLLGVVPGREPGRRIHARLPATGAYLYCSGIAPDPVVTRWDLERDREAGSWPAPDAYGKVTLSRSGRYCIIAQYGIGRALAFDTGTGEPIMPGLLDADSTLHRYAFAPDETGFAYVAGGRACFRDMATQSRTKGPELYDAMVNELHGAWDAEVYVCVTDARRLCVVRMP
jgi:hypothetical protein